jgi:hypothetical protein
MNHPNYAAVTVEVAALPLVHSAWRTATVFSIANALVLNAPIRATETIADALGRRLSTASRSPTPAGSPPKLALRHAELHRAMPTARERHNSSRSRDHNLDSGSRWTTNPQLARQNSQPHEPLGEEFLYWYHAWYLAALAFDSDQRASATDHALT